MPAALESSATLEEILLWVGSKRVAMAPELAGYLVLELVQSLGSQRGDLDVVYIGEEGSVAPIVTLRDGSDVEQSVRDILGRLLDAAATQTPALQAVAKKRSGGDIVALAAEIESALIPVNRAP
jgi:hypothetical protein